MTTTAMHVFETGTELAQALAGAVAGTLADAIALRGRASLAVSGGSTPKAFFKMLSSADIDWAHVTVTLVDERFVAPDSDRSNEKLVRDSLLRNAAAPADFVPLYRDRQTAGDAAAIVTTETAALCDPFDAVILGMGTDGHTASFFPGGSRLAEALDPETPRGVITMEADGAAEPRLTFTFSSLHDAGLLVLHIEGAAKKDVLAKAEAPGDVSQMPIRAVLRHAASPVHVYWAP